MRACPELVGGEGRSATRLMQGVPGLIAKDGAEAVYAAALPDGRAVALKIGGGADRARQVVMAALLLHLGIEDDAGRAALDAMTRPPVLGHGQPVGNLLPVQL
jgi:L-asparaginase II